MNDIAFMRDAAEVYRMLWLSAKRGRKDARLSMRAAMKQLIAARKDHGEAEERAIKAEKELEAEREHAKGLLGDGYEIRLWSVNDDSPPYRGIFWKHEAWLADPSVSPGYSRRVTEGESKTATHGQLLAFMGLVSHILRDTSTGLGFLNARSERDAAIRERDTLRQTVKELTEKLTEAESRGRPFSNGERAALNEGLTKLKAHAEQVEKGRAAAWHDRDVAEEERDKASKERDFEKAVASRLRGDLRTEKQLRETAELALEAYRKAEKAENRIPLANMTEPCAKCEHGFRFHRFGPPHACGFTCGDEDGSEGDGTCCECIGFVSSREAADSSRVSGDVAERKAP